MRLAVAAAKPLAHVKDNIHVEIIDLRQQAVDVADTLDRVAAARQGRDDAIDRFELVELGVNIAGVIAGALPVAF
ncbi:MAG: hypothetical protein KAS92_04605 [Candidatus Omnitrophica bacterium]|nr:hypothetical protein [Candidatus Omnitrophota bacterium]